MPDPAISQRSKYLLRLTDRDLLGEKIEAGLTISLGATYRALGLSENLEDGADSNSLNWITGQKARELSLLFGNTDVMDSIASTDLKTILHSKRANLYYLEHCRVLVNGGRVEYVTDTGKRSLYWNIPIANTTCILLGTGTSITQAAMRELAKAGVLVGFAGGGGTPLFSANEMDIEVAWLAPQSEYRPTEYLQAWVRFWFDDDLRLMAAKTLQAARLQRLREQWLTRPLREAGFAVDAARLDTLTGQFTQRITTAPDVTALLTDEAQLTKALFKLAVDATRYGEFTRAKRGSGTDAANRFLDHGNYLAYGLGATAT